jgi:hypothetical protein
MNHVRRFRLREVESDFLKILYESLIDREERHRLGEYYTPDWLAAKVVRHAVDRPLEQKSALPGVRVRNNQKGPGSVSGSPTHVAIQHAIRDA